MPNPNPPKANKKTDMAVDGDPRNSSLFVGSAEKTFQILHAFDHPKRQMPLSEIATLSGLDRSAAQRLVFTLEALGYLRRVHNSRDYALTSRVLQFSYNFLCAHELLHKAAPYLVDLSSTLGETTNLQELAGHEVIYVGRYPGRHLMNVDIMVGSRLPAVFTASGTAILSHASREEQEAAIAATPLRALTPHTITDKGLLLERMQRAAETGYAIIANETVLGDIAVASAILDEHGHAVAAITIAVPTTRWTKERVEAELTHHVQVAATSISAKKFF